MTVILATKVYTYKHYIDKYVTQKQINDKGNIRIPQNCTLLVLFYLSSLSCRKGMVDQTVDAWLRAWRVYPNSRVV